MKRTLGISNGLLSSLVAASLATGLLACGGASSTSTTTVTSAASATTTPVASAPASTTTSPVSRPSAPAATTTTPSTQTRGSSGGAAASFRVQRGDNSIPEYGQEAGASERARAATALATFLQARAKGEWSLVCTELAGPTREQLERLVRAAKAKGSGGCGQVLAALTGHGPASTRADPLTSGGGMAALRVKGTTAFALFYGSHHSKYVMPMRNEGGSWKVSQITPLPYPLGTPGVAPGG
jgi:hypothetical protein